VFYLVESWHEEAKEAFKEYEEEEVEEEEDI